MKRFTVPSKSWILVCDGSKALLFQNAGDALAPNLKAVDVQFEAHEQTRELGEERPGRVHESLGERRSSMEAPDYHAIAETQFLAKAIRRLDELVREHKVKHLIVAAPPKALGILRGQFTPGIRAVLSAEIAKDLVKLPTVEIERHLLAMGEGP